MHDARDDQLAEGWGEEGGYFLDGEGERVAGVAGGEERGRGVDGVEVLDYRERVHHCAVRCWDGCFVHDCWEGVGGSGGVGGDVEAAEERCDVWVGDPALGVGDFLEVEDGADFQGVWGPGF